MKNIMTNILGLISVIGIQGVKGQVVPDNPNVILIMTDDQGYGELSCHGNPILQTPEIDKLYSQSVRLTNYHAAPMSTATRGQLMTGLDAARNGALNVSSGRTMLRAGIPTMGDVFKENGYNTGIFGKWHLGDTYPYTPDCRGFQETLWFPSSHMGAIPDHWGNTYFDAVYISNGEKKKIDGYCTDIFFDNAMAWMKESLKDNKPFFTYLPLNAPHEPWFAPEKNIREMEAAFAKSKEFSNMNPELKRNIIHYLAMIRNIDENVGRLLRFLDKNGLADNTILIFTTDNGTTFGDRYYNAGMRGCKAQLWEGGHRVPFFIRWPKGNLVAPRDIDGLTNVQDVLPSLMGLCGLTFSKPLKTDGIDLSGVFRMKTCIPDDRMVVVNYSRIPGNYDYPSPESPSLVTRDGAAVLWKQWRLLNDSHLYNLETDPSQQHNVIDDHPDVLGKMRMHLYDWWDCVKEIVNEPQPTRIGEDKEKPVILSSCEWLDVYVDQQAQVRQGLRKNSYWVLDVACDGEYKFELRRWPREANAPLNGITAVNKMDVALPVEFASISIEGKYQQARIDNGAESATFSVRLKAGPALLHTWFLDKQNQAICGAYYVYVVRE